MIRNLDEADFVPRLGLTAGTFAMWAAVFMSFVEIAPVTFSGLLAVPVVLAAVLFGVRGAVVGSAIGIVLISVLSVISGAGSIAVLTEGSGPINVVVLVSLATMVGYGRRFSKSESPVESGSTVGVKTGETDSNARRAQLNNIAGDFIDSVHDTLVIEEVSRCVTTHVTRALKPDFFAISVADVVNRRIKVKQSIGLHLLGFGVGEYRSVSATLEDPMSDGEIEVWRGRKYSDLTDRSLFAATAIPAGMDSAMTANFRQGDDLIAQLWIGSSKTDSFTPDEVEFVEKIRHHLESALVNARNAESVKELQRQLVGQNEILANMQDGIEYNEGELRLDHEELVELSESKTQFMSEVAHEIKTPLSVMIGYADLLRFDTENLGNDQREYAESIEKSARQLAVLIDDLSDISNIESGHFSMSKTEHDVVSVVSSVIDGLVVFNPLNSERLDATGVMASQFIDGDPARLSQVFTNLITNALKYSSTEHKIVITAMATDQKFEFSVKDSGLGISDADLERLFTPYFRSSNPDALEREGTGLGLFLSRSIVEAHGGTLTVSSTVGLGSTFSVNLPVAEMNLNARAA
jgi:signal transduction histidine kinase